MKYMFAILCSNPAATNAETGKMIATALSTTLRPAIAIHTAMHTSTLHSTPRKNASQNGRAHLAIAIWNSCARDLPVIQRAVPGQINDHHKPRGADKISGADDCPVAQHIAGGETAFGPGHDQ